MVEEACRSAAQHLRNRLHAHGPVSKCKIVSIWATSVKSERKARMTHVGFGTRSVSDCASESSSFKSTPYLVPKRDAPDSVSVRNHDRSVSFSPARRSRLRRLTGREGHVVGSAGQDHVRFSEFDLLRGVDDRLEATPAQPVGQARCVSNQLGAQRIFGDGADGRRALSPRPTHRLTVKAGTSTGNPARWPTCLAK